MPGKSLLTVSFITLCVVYYAMADTYHVATSGSDQAGDGSRLNPWSSVSHACANSALESGDTIRIQSGTYNETASANLPVGVSLIGDGQVQQY